MKRLTLLAAVFAIFALVGCEKGVEGEGDTIYYTTTDGAKVEINDAHFDAEVSSNTYSNGVGTIVFNGPVFYVGEAAFAGCKTLSSVTLPSNVQIIGKDAFTGCTALSGISLSNSLVTIEGYAFYGCTALTEVVLPSRVSIIDDHAFAHCSSLARFEASESLISIGPSAFFHCDNLAEFDMTRNDSLTEIRYAAFDECNALESFEVPASFLQIHEKAFFHAASLKSFKIHAPKRATSGLDMFANVHEDFAIYVPMSLVESYKEVNYWKLYQIIGF